MKTLNTFSLITFCSLLIISTASFADKRHSGHSNNTKHSTGFSRQQDNKQNQHPQAYSHNQRWQAKKRSNKQHYQQQHNHSGPYYSSNNYRPKHYGYKKYQQKHYNYTNYRPKHSNDYYRVQRYNNTLNRLNYYNPGLNVYVKF